MRPSSSRLSRGDLDTQLDTLALSPDLSAARFEGVRELGPAPPPRESPPGRPGPGHRGMSRILGPGFITGACSDDPGSIGTYSQVGAQFGFGLAWTLLFTYPLLVAVQEISARIGRVTGCGIAANLRRHYSGWFAGSLVGLLCVANVINLAADLGAMGAVLRLLLDAPALLYVCLLALACVLFEVFTGYERYVRTLKWLCLSLLSYVIGAFVVEVPWKEVAHALVWPPLSAAPQYVTAVVAALGTTITPYLFFWQAQQEVESARQAGRVLTLLRSAPEAPAEFARIRIDTVIGMGLSSLIALFIVITTASTLHAQGVHTIETAAQAAEALHALAGRFTFVVFALGIVGAGLVALPALSNSTAYAVGELLNWRVGGSHPPRRARAFYAGVVAATAIGCVLNLSPINPMRALYWSAVLNGVVAIPLMIAMMHLSNRTRVMGSLKPSRGVRALGWVATAAMAVSVAGMVVSWLV
jgi:NRAMP (natural resistance-associated macrophage protein)-like metal ion transporter